MLNLMHVAVHNAINHNAGDVVLVEATRRCFEHFLGPITWTLHQAWEPFDVALANQHDGVVVGGGGMLLPDQEGASYEASGWQWNSTIADVQALKVPLIIFAVGDNRFRHQEGFRPIFYQHWGITVEQAAFVGMREHAKPTPPFVYQPCPTTCLWQLYPAHAIQLAKYPCRIGINVAFDRYAFRFPVKTDRCLYDLVSFCYKLESEGCEVTLIHHKPQDEQFASYFAPQAMKMYHISNAPPDMILSLYTDIDLTIGMRSHSQLIPFGLRKRIVSMISHDKLQRFLDDIGHPEWGCDVLSRDFAADLAAAYQFASSVPQSVIDAAQQRCWDVTTENMERIKQILCG